MASIYKKIESEIDSYLNSSVEISEGVHFSQYKLVKRIYLFKNKVYPKGKTDKQGHYKLWPDIIVPRVNNEVKNLRIDTKHPLVFSNAPVKDFGAVSVINIALKDFMWKTGRAEEFNEATENFSADGNILLKKMKKGYELWDPLNTFIINTTAKTVDETAIIERHQLTQSELRGKAGLWDNIEEVIENCGNKQFSSTERTEDKETTNPYYEIYERNGEVTEKELFEAQGKGGGREDRYILAKIVVAGLTSRDDKDEDKYVLYAQPLGKKKLSDIYVEAHRGPYNGRWWREGLYELLFDYQVDANQVVNDISKGLKWAGKIIFKDPQNKTIQNIITDINNGDIIKSEGLTQVEVRLQGLDQLIANWNRIIQDADRVANSFEVVTGEEMKSQTPFRLGLLQDTNANKLFVYLRQKLGLAYNKAFKSWVLEDLIKDLSGKEIFRITGNSGLIDSLRRMSVENWYIMNLVRIGPHTPEMATALKEAKYQELIKVDPVLKNVKKIWEGVIDRLWVSITGDNNDLDDEQQTIFSLIQLETDPVRRQVLLDRLYAINGILVPPPVQAQIPQVAPSGKPQQEKKKGVSEFETVSTVKD
jgi:hypothetical protein